uniref:FYVE, RhoGEF and PH domain-containing protein 6 n=1 Tax=Cacopsylla melanoneura TaxID=428564 RepID=A0A8D8V2T4_9HEMI
MALPSNQLPKPMTPPKPPRLTSKESTKNKFLKIVIDKNQKPIEIESQCKVLKVVIDKNKVKPPILPKPQNLKPKPFNNGETSVIDSSSCRQTSQINLHHPQDTVSNEVIDNKEKLNSSNYRHHFKNEDNRITNTIKVLQSNIEKGGKNISPRTSEFVPNRNDETYPTKPIRNTKSLPLPKEAASFSELHTETYKQSRKEHFKISNSESNDFESKRDSLKDKNRNNIPDLPFITIKDESLQPTNSSDVIDIHHKNEKCFKVKDVILNLTNENKDSSLKKSSTQLISPGSQDKTRENNPLYHELQNGILNKQDTSLDTPMRNGFNQSNNINRNNMKLCPSIEDIENKDNGDCSAVESNSITPTCSDKTSLEEQEDKSFESEDESLLVLTGASSSNLLIGTESNSQNKILNDKKFSSQNPVSSCTITMGNVICQENVRNKLVNETCTKENTSEYEAIYQNIVDIEPNHVCDDTNSSMTNDFMKTETAQPSFLHSKSADSLKIEEIERNIEILLSTKHTLKLTDTNPSIQELNKTGPKHLPEERWKSRSLGRRYTHPASNIVDTHSARSLTSLVKDHKFKNDLSNVLNRPNGIHPNEPLGQTPKQNFNYSLENSLPYFKNNPEDSTNKEPIYAEPVWSTPNQPIRPAPDKPASMTNPINRDYPSDASEDSNESSSEINTSLPVQPPSVLHLVTSSFNLFVRNVSSKVTEGNASPKMKSKVKRNPSVRSTNSLQEDNESIGSDSTEDSYSRRNRSWLGSFRNKRSSSQFYYDDLVPDHSESEISGQNDTSGSLLGNILPEHDPVYQDSIPHDEDDNDIDRPVPSEPHNTEIVEPLSPEEIAEKKKRKAFLVAQEIMTSEKEFIGVLSLLRNDMKEHCRSSDIPESELNNLIIPEELLTLNETLYKDFEERIKNWSTVPKIADIFVKKGPFLKLYTTYCQNFQARYDLLDEYCSKYPVFQKKLKEFEMSEICKKLTVKHYLLKPIQRIPQYKLLLEQYLKQLDPDAIDHGDAEKSLEIVSAVAEHANGSMKLDDQLRKLLDIQYQLGNYEIIKPGRIFIKEGQLLKLSRRGKQERFFILLSDCLLYTSYYGTQAGYHLNYELPLNGMKVCLPKTEDYQNEFSIITVKRSFTLQASSIAEREEWMKALETAIQENQKHLLSFINRPVDSDLQLGKVDAVWIPDDRVSMCQLCTSVFTVTFRRHHCRACGKVVCSPCSNYEAPLQCKKFRSVRVCKECFDYLTNEFIDPDANMFDRIKTELNLDFEQTNSKIESLRYDFKHLGDAGTKKPREKVPDRLLEVTANDAGAQVTGWLNKKSGRSWKRYWFVLKDHVLYRYKASEDIAAEKSVAILGYNMTQLNKQDNFKYVFELTHVGSDTLVFGLNNEQSFNKWMSAMREATKPLC